MKCENCTKTECSKKQKNDENQSSTRESVDTTEENGETSEFHKLAGKRVYLSDCLACDRCVSEEESQRISQQNQKELFGILNLNKKCDTSKHKVLVASLSPQSLPYFAVKLNLNIPEATKKLCSFLKSLGFHHVFDATLASDFSILESQKEFVERYRQRNQDQQALPMFTSACPGWIRYAERVLGSQVTPHICTAKSPQQIMGSLVKDYFAKQQGLAPETLYHVVVAPCFDKKLEALREEFYNSLQDSQDVDCVLTSEIRLTLRGMEKSLPPSSPSRQPISTDLLLHLIIALRQGCFNPFDDIVMETLCLIAFFGFLRCSEFSTPSTSSFPALGLKRSDLSQIPGNHFILHIRSSKTDQLSQGFRVFRRIPSSSTAPDL
ncbi:UNVERIFIED_CONTAM: hypothetical protein FKN15_055417 [Acipenser sinensis]